MTDPQYRAILEVIDDALGNGQWTESFLSLLVRAKESFIEDFKEDK